MFLFDKPHSRESIQAICNSEERVEAIHQQPSRMLIFTCIKIDRILGSTTFTYACYQVPSVAAKLSSQELYKAATQYNNTDERCASLCC